MNQQRNTRFNLKYLSYLNRGQLKEVLENETTLQGINKNNPKLQQHQKQIELMLDSNRKLAQQNLSFKPHLKYNKMLLAEKYKLLSQLVSSVRHKRAKLVDIHRRMRHEAIQKLLHVKLAHFRHQFENIWQKFLDGELQPGDFVKSFQRVQTLYHANLIQVEKMQEPGTDWRIDRLISSDRIPSKSGNMFYNLHPVLMLPRSVYPILPEIGHWVNMTHLPHITHCTCDDLSTPVVYGNNLETFMDHWQPNQFKHRKRSSDTMNK